MPFHKHPILNSKEVTRSHLLDWAVPQLTQEELAIILDEEKCRGTGICMEVCPRGCFDMDGSNRTIRFARPDDCEQCAACIVQCPFDALSFVSDRGERISPEITRKYKLNLMGKRQIKAL